AGRRRHLSLPAPRTSRQLGDRAQQELSVAISASGPEAEVAAPAVPVAPEPSPGVPAPRRHLVQMTVGAEFLELLDKVRSALSHSHEERWISSAERSPSKWGERRVRDEHIASQLARETLA